MTLVSISKDKPPSLEVEMGLSQTTTRKWGWQGISLD
jgi:hypothetical protein